MRKVLFTEKDITNLDVFLGRITFKGSEFTALRSIINALNAGDIIGEDELDEQPQTKTTKPAKQS